jgi:hypothetical protein
VDADVVDRECQYSVTHARAAVADLVERLMSELPESATEDDKRRIRAETGRLVDDVLRCFSETDPPSSR